MKRFSFALLVALLLSVIYADNSGVKVAIDASIAKAATKIDWNKYVQNVTLLNFTSISGKAVFEYQINISNVVLTNVDGPKGMDIHSAVNEEGFQTVYINMTQLAVNVSMDFAIKFGIFSESGEAVKVYLQLNSFAGNFYFNKAGEISISNFTCEVGDLDIEFESEFLSWLVSLFKGIFKDLIEEQVGGAGAQGQEAINKWIHEETLIDTGYGIGVNVTCTEIPVLTPFDRAIKAKNSIVFILKLLYYWALDSEGKKQFMTDNEYTSAIVTLGIHGAAYPNQDPSLKPQVEPAVPMEYEKTWYDNQAQVLISDYTINTGLFILQQTGMLKYEMNEQTTPKILPITFTTQGFGEIIPEFKTKYPTDNFPVTMLTYVKMGGYNQPLINTKTDGTYVKVNFGLELNTYWSEDIFDDPTLDVKLNLTMEGKVEVLTDGSVVNVVIGEFKVTQIDKTGGEMEVDLNNVKAQLEKLFNESLVPYFDPYIKDIKVIELIEEAIGLKFKKIRMKPMNGYNIASIGLDGI